MSSDPREKAQRSLGEVMEQLKALRTSNVRDTEFKQWRQATLTLVQRIWAGDAKRSARFRRIPFSPPSSQASLRETREYYERGCAEAAQLLKSFLDEIEENGMPTASGAAQPASLGSDLLEDDFPTLELPGGPERNEPAKADPGPPQPSRDDASGGGVSVRGSSRRDDGNARRPERRKRQTKNGPRRRLRDMLGLDALEKLGRHEEPSTPRLAGIEGTPPPETRGEEHRRDARQAPPSRHEARQDETPDERELDDALREVEAAEDTPPLAEPDTSWQARAEEDDDMPAAADPEDETDAASLEDDSDVAEVPFTADEFLSASPIFHTEGKPVRRAKRQAPPEPAEADGPPSPLTSGTAIAVAAIASEVARLGVPDGHRARTRATLINLAQMIEDGTMDWESLRNALAFAMEFPPIGRRLVPLLVPFLDRAA